MRSLALVVLAACGVKSTGSRHDAEVVVPPRDASRLPIDAPVDAYVRRACDAPPTFADGIAPTRVLHVEAGAVGGDGSQAAPFGSIAAAAAIATPGTFIQLGPGVHATNQFIPDLRGTAEAPIWIGGVFGTRPMIRGGSEGLHLTRAAYVVIQHLAFEDQTSNGINIDDGVSFGNDAHHVALVDLALRDIVTDPTSACIKISGVDDLAIHDSRFIRCGIGVDLLGSHRAVIARNAIANTVMHGVQARGGSTDIDVRQNRIAAAGGSGVMLGAPAPLAQFRPPVSTTTSNADVRRVRAFDNAITASTYIPFTLYGCIDCLVAHNLTFGAPMHLMRLWQGTPSQNDYVFEPTTAARVINNSFVWTSTLSVHVDASPGTSASTVAFANNLWQAATAAPSSSVPNLPVPQTGAIIGAGTGYSYDASTPYCEGAEVNAAAPLPEVDGTIEGFCRADAAAPTIGPQIPMVRGCIPI